jgi:hypothetical protein
MKVTVVAAQERWKGDKATLYDVTVQADGKMYIVKTWSKAIGTGIGKEFDVVSEKRKNKQGQDESFIKQVGAGSGGNGAWRKSADNSLATALNCACMIHAAQIRQGIKYSPGDVLIMADNFLTWMKAKE